MLLGNYVFAVMNLGSGVFFHHYKVDNGVEEERMCLEQLKRYDCYTREEKVNNLLL